MFIQHLYAMIRPYQTHKVTFKNAEKNIPVSLGALRQRYQIYYMKYMMKISPAQTKIAIFSFLLLLPGSGALAFYESDNLHLAINDHEENIPFSEFSEWLKYDPVLIKHARNKAEIENIYYCSRDLAFCQLAEAHREKIKVRKEDTTSTDAEKIRSFIDDLGRRVNKDPVDAKFKIEEGKVTAFELGKNGIRLDPEKSAAIIKDNLLRNNYSEKINLAYEIIKPAMESEDINSLGLDNLIGEGKSNFRGSPQNRIHNIKVATSRFNGVLIKPGEEFSFVSVLGDVDEEHGYKAELVIKKDKTEPEFGGGICQVSTTAFRAALYSGLKITARRNHAYPVSYYNPQGMDATVYIPRPDLRFQNNTPNHILIQTEITGTELTFRFYGTSDGRRIEIEGPKITERNPDGSMKTVFTQRVYTKDNDTLIEDIFKSAYDSPAKYPHPGEVVKLAKKPKDWSDNEWKEYKNANGL